MLLVIISIVTNPRYKNDDPFEIREVTRAAEEREETRFRIVETKKNSDDRITSKHQTPGCYLDYAMLQQGHLAYPMMGLFI